MFLSSKGGRKQETGERERARAREKGVIDINPIRVNSLYEEYRFVRINFHVILT